MWGAIASFFGSILARLFSYETLKYLAYRAFVISICLTILPIAVFKGFSYILQFLINYATSHIQAGNASFIVHLTGLAGFLGTHLNLSQAFSVILSAVALRFLLRLVRVG